MLDSKKFQNGYILLVGVGADLPVTVQDAVAVRNVFIDPLRASYPPEQVTLLTEADATREQILGAFDNLIAQVNKNLEATVIVYYSGHGGCIKGANEYFLVPYGYDPSQREKTAISGLEFTQKIESIKAQKLIVLLDCCHAGGVPALKDREEIFIKSPVPPDLLNTLRSGSGRVVVASSREDEYSYTGNPYSIFTSCLLEALEGKAAVNLDGYARILDVLIYLFDQVPKRASGSQHPFVNKVLDLGDNFPICYYAGGSKKLHGETLTPVPNPVITNLTSGQRHRLKQMQERLQAEYDLRSEKMKLMRGALVIEASTTIKFQLEHQLLEEESRLAHLIEELETIESSLQSS